MGVSNTNPRDLVKHYLLVTVTVMLTLAELARVTVPVMTPVIGSIVSPGGNPTADQR